MTGILPVDSPIEDIFAWDYSKYQGDCTIRTQYECVTPSTTYRLDFIIRSKTVSVGVECDGREFHDEERDKKRDASIVEHCDVDTIVRFTGSALFLFTYDCLDMLRRYQPSLFRGLAERNFTQLSNKRDEDFVDDGFPPHHSVVRELRADPPEGWEGDDFNYVSSPNRRRVIMTVTSNLKRLPYDHSEYQGD